MADSQPTMAPGGIQAVSARYDAPSHRPSGQMESAAGAVQMAVADAGQSFRAPSAPPTMQASPSLPTPGTTVSGAAAWQSSKKVDALWTIGEDGNSWIGVAGIGWKKLAHPNETAVCALTMLAAHARCTNASVDYRDESDNMIHEIYVW